MNKPKFKRLFLDIETSPNVGLFWRAGFKLNIDPANIIKERAIICIGWKWEHDAEVSALTWDRLQRDEAMLRKFAKVLNEADEVVFHNGDRFDLPWIRTRLLKHGVSLPPGCKTVDTLRIARRLFLFNSNKLDYIARYLGLGAKISTGFGLWKEVVLESCQEALAKMVTYCKGDVLLLQAVWEKLRPSSEHISHQGVFEGGAGWSCPHCGSVSVVKAKTRVSATGQIKHQMRCKDCGGFYTINQSQFKKYENR